MTTSDIPLCERVQMAAMAHLDGERADLSSTEIDAHLAGCQECRAAVAAMATLHPSLNRLDYETLDLDVWPAVHDAITTDSARSERRIVLALATALVVWRFGQLSIGLPAPVVNSVVPLALTMLALWRLTGDPFAIKVTANQLQQQRGV